MDVVIGNSRDIELNVSYVSMELDVNVGTEIELVQMGVQGLRGPEGPEGPIGEPLEFEALTEQQKIELRGDVGDPSSVNYANLLYSTFLS
jgi:hypothetical protein